MAIAMASYNSSFNSSNVYTGTATGGGVNLGTTDWQARIDYLMRELSMAQATRQTYRHRGDALLEILHRVQDLLEEWTDAAAVLDGQPSISIADIVAQLSKALENPDGQSYVDLNGVYLDYLAEQERQYS